MQYLGEIVPWRKLKSPKDLHSASRTSAALSILMPESEQGEHDICSTKLSTSTSKLGDHLSVMLYLISNNLIPQNKNRPFEMYRNDKMILQVLKDTGWNDLKHLKILLSTREPTAESIAEKSFAAALRRRNFEVVEHMLRSGMNSDVLIEDHLQSSMGSFLTPLQYVSSYCEDAHLMNLLISYGADVNFSVNSNGQTALFYAIQRKNETAIRLLLSRSVTVTQECVEGAGYVTPGHFNDFSLIEGMIDIYLGQDKARGRDETGVLYPAVIHNNIQIVKRFIASGAKLNGLVKTMRGPAASKTTLLGIAVEAGVLDMVRLLIRVSTAPDSLATPSTYIPPLTLAAMNGFYDIAEILLNSGADIQTAGHGERTLLEYAALANEYALCQLLIKYGARVDREFCDIQKSRSALMIAVQENETDIVELLISSKARLNDSFDLDPGTLLGAAIEVGNGIIIKKLVDAGAISVGFRMKRLGNLQTALFLQNAGLLQGLLKSSGVQFLTEAILAQENELTWFLLQNNADKGSDKRVYCVQPPLSAAAHIRDFRLAQTLIERGAKVKDDVIAEAIEYEPEILPALLIGFRGSAPTAISAAILNTSMVALQLLREANVDLRGVPRTTQREWMKRGIYGFIYSSPASVLEVATLAADDLMFKYILEWAFSEKTSWSAQSIARSLTQALVQEKHHNVLELMRLVTDVDYDISNGRLPFTDTIYTWSPLQAAVRSQQVWLVRDLLVSKRADVNYLGGGKLRRTPLQHAVELGNMEIFNLLLDHGADVNAPAAFDGGATALQIAAIRGYIGIARRLLDLGADVNQDPALENGRTALMGAAEYGRIDMLQMLLDEGALVVGEDYEDWYFKAVELADNHGHHAAARLLKSFKE